VPREITQSTELGILELGARRAEQGNAEWKRLQWPMTA
jgi:hypothetical protein